MKGAETCSMGGPFVIPEFFIGSIVVNPELIHEIQCGGSPIVSQQGADVSVIAGWITVLAEGPVAVVRPQTVYSPAIIWPGSWIGVPELGLQQ